ncbi:MAG: TetR/AcrR family transcriptional regulator [Actinobacteria bacterium]|nr:TetR/AcrR family transcriptional regulator [Actinomycetota bacterium]
MRRSLAIDPAEVVASVAQTHAADAVATRVLDAAAELYERIGIRRCSVEDIAEHSGVGRTTIYRRFEGRQQILEAVLGREVRRFFASMIGPSAHLARFDDVVVESFLAGLTATETSLLTTLVRAEPELLALLTIDAAPIIDAAREFLVSLYRTALPDKPADGLDALIDALVRLAISLVLTPSPLFPTDDPDTARTSLHRLLDPMLVAYAT